MEGNRGGPAPLSAVESPSSGSDEGASRARVAWHKRNLEMESRKEKFPPWAQSFLKQNAGIGEGVGGTECSAGAVGLIEEVRWTALCLCLLSRGPFTLQVPVHFTYWLNTFMRWSYE